MDCKDARPLMHDYLDGELSSKATAELKSHIMECPSCRTRYTQLEKAGGMIRSLQPTAVPPHLSTERIMQQIPVSAKRTAWMKWIRRHPAASVAVVFLIVMLSSFLSMWNNNDQLVVKVSELDKVVIEGKTVIVPEGSTIQGNLVVENGTIQVNGDINGNLVVIDGSYNLASTAHISGQITRVDQALEWLWFKMNQLFSSASR